MLLLLRSPVDSRLHMCCAPSRGHAQPETAVREVPKIKTDSACLALDPAAFYNCPERLGLVLLGTMSGKRNLENERQ